MLAAAVAGFATGASSVPPIGIGDQFPAHVSATASTPEIDLSITVDLLTCGIAEFAGSSTTLESPDGYRYCEADLDITNVGGASTGKLSLTGTVRADDEGDYASDPDATKAAGAVVTTLNSKSYGGTATPPIPAGGSAETAVAWALPLGVAPVQLTFAGSGMTGATGGAAIGPVAAAADDIEWRLPKGQ